MFLTAASRLGVARGDCLVIEDAPAGIEAGNAAGMAVVALAGAYSPDKLGQADRIISSLNELIIADPANA